MKKSVSKIIELVITLACFLTVLFSVGNSAISNVSAEDTLTRYFVDETDSFKYKYQDHQFVCYKTYAVADKTTKTTVLGVAIKWLEYAPAVQNATMGTTLNLPETVYKTAADETGQVNGLSVIAIAKGAFSRTTFQTFSIPDGVREIKEEAFAYCSNMTTVVLPSDINQIAPSTFLDCRQLKAVYYRANGSRSLENSTIKKIGDHAFDSCTSLISFICPRKVEVFGNSCFQRCTSLLSFRFPTSEDVDSVTIGEYAFADCSSLESVCFEDNIDITKIPDYAFVDCRSSLVFTYSGSDTTNLNKLGLWRRKYLAAGIVTDLPYEKGVQDPTNDYYGVGGSTSDKILSTDTYKGLRYKVKSVAVDGVVKLDSAGLSAGPTLISSDSYAIITDFIPPSAYIDNFYVSIPGDVNNNNVKDAGENWRDGDDYRIIIPATLPTSKTVSTPVPVKVIDSGAFFNYDNNQRLKEVVFNTNLVQIRHEAFLDCTKISKLDFSNCQTTLKEISYDVFQKPKSNQAEEVYNTYLHDLVLPQSLEYIGEFAFYNFLQLDGTLKFTCDDNSTSNLATIGAYAFAVNSSLSATDSKRSTKATIDLVLPASLKDSVTYSASYLHVHNGLRSMTIAYVNRNNGMSAVGNCAFQNMITLRSVTMETQASDTYTTSFGIFAFSQCINLLFFKANDRLLYLGKSLFDNCKSLKEVFLTVKTSGTKYLASSNCPSPWGVNSSDNNYGGTLFSGTVCQDVVVYIAAASAPNNCDTINGNVYRWNVPDGDSYGNELFYSGTGVSNRSKIPTYYKVDWQGDKGPWSNDKYRLYYFKPSGSYASATAPSTAPVSIANYNQGLVAILQNVGTNKTDCIVTRYYYSGSKSPIYKSNVAITTAEPFTQSKWDAVSEYSSSSTYTKDTSYVVYNDNLYKCNTTISTAEEWNSAHWTIQSPSYYSASATYSKGAFVRFSSDAVNTIDLTSITLNANHVITTIGEEAFATDGDEGGAKISGFYFILPTDVTKIGERAFYRKGTGAYGVRIITYKTNTTKYKTPTATDITAADADALDSALDNYYGSNGGYCCLPTGVTTIERNAFYNNIFKEVVLGTNIAFLGNGAFYVHPVIGTDSFTIRSQIQSITFVGNSNFELINDGIYYGTDVEENGVHTFHPHTLLYQIPISTNAVGSRSFTVADGTVAIGMRAVANTNYETVVLNDELKTIYGGAFQKSNYLETVSAPNGLGNLTHISANGLETSQLRNTWEQVVFSYSKYYDYVAYATGTIVSYGSDFYVAKSDIANTNTKKPTDTSLWATGNYNKSSPYAVGDIVVNSKALYVCKTAIGAGGENWTAAHWLKIEEFSYNKTNYAVGQCVLFSGLIYKCTGTNNSGTYFDAIDSGDVNDQNNRALHGAFEGCKSLKTINFSAMTSLNRIGKNAFRDCSSLKEMMGTNKYTIYLDGALQVNNSGDNILDLSAITSLRRIEENAFNGCAYDSGTGKGINYFILPNSTGGNVTDEAQLTVSGTTPFSTSTNVLVGDTVNQAHAGRGSGYSVASHYPAAVFADKDQRTYYRTFTVDDIEDFGSTKTRYWKRVDNTIYLYSTPALAIASYGS